MGWKLPDHRRHALRVHRSTTGLRTTPPECTPDHDKYDDYDKYDDHDSTDHDKCDDHDCTDHDKCHDHDSTDQHDPNDHDCTEYDGTCDDHDRRDSFRLMTQSE